MNKIQNQLSEELAEVEWRDLVPHAQRDVVIVVADSLNLLEVGEAIASDNVALVQTWIGGQLLQKPTTEQLSNWNAHPMSLFNTLIVQPFVLVQTIA
jgi:hypothetical protein